MMYTSGKNEGELDGGEGNVVGINTPSSLGGAKDDILQHGTPGFGRRHDADQDSDPSSKGKGLGFHNKQSGLHAAKKRRIGEIVSNIADQHNFLSQNNHGAPLQEEALRAISKGQANQGSVFNLNQNIDLRSSHLGRLQQQQEDMRSTQLGRLQQQHAALEARLQQQQQQQSQPQGMGLGGPAQSPFGNFSGPATGMFPQASLSFLGQSVGGHPMFGAGLMGGTGLSGMMDPNSLAGLGGLGAAADRSAMTHQLSFPGATGITQTNSGGAADFGGDDTTLTSLGLTSSTGRQLLLMQQALSGGGAPGGAMLPGLQGQFLASMQGFGMPSDPSSLGQQKMPELGMPGGVRGGLQLNGNNNGNKITAPNGHGASTTLSGISHQALYSRDIPDEDENDCDSKKLVLYMTCDDDSLSAYQCLVRKQIELFAAKEEDVESNAQGRNKPIILGQVGIRCRHCSKIPPRHRTRGATYYPAKLHGLYQAAQNMASAHLCNHCQLIPDALRQDLVVLRDRKSSAGGGKQYWADGVRVLGVVESNNVLLFEASAQAQKEEKEKEETRKSDTTDIGATGPNAENNEEEDDKEEKQSF